jgi:hypothetical protein
MTDRDWCHAGDDDTGVDALGEPTAEDAGRFLFRLRQTASAGVPPRLPERSARDCLAEEFGERFIERIAGVRGISADVLAAFTRLLVTGVVFDARDRAWR